MSALPTESVLHGVEEAIRDAIVARCYLTSDVINNIMQARASLAVGFAEAAVQIGAVTADDVAAVIVEVNKSDADNGTSIVETALRRRTSSSQLVAVRQPELLKPSGRLILAHDLDNDRSERIRALRTELLLLSNSAGLANIIALVSPCSGEGRSQLAAELAIAFAQLGRRTLLVDADLRKPQQHFLFNASNNVGLAQALTSGDSPRLFGVENLPYLSVLIAGAAAPNPLELLSGSRMQRLIAHWHGDQEFVLIDTPPIGHYADGLAIATMASRALVVSRAQATPHKDMKNMLRRLATTRSHIFGAVINSF